MPSSAERSGSFATQDPVLLLRDLTGSGFSGSVRTERDGVIKVLYLLDGRLACASSTDPHDRLGPLLCDAGQITAQQLVLAEDKAVAGEALGSVLVSLGFIGPAGLMWGARRQVEQVVATLLTWNDGKFRCCPGRLPERAVNLKLSLPSVVLGAVRLLPRREDVTARLGSLDVHMRRVAGASFPCPEDEAMRGVWDLLDGNRDLRGVCAESTLDDFDAARVALGLYLLGVVERVEAAALTAAPADLVDPLIEEIGPAVSERTTFATEEFPPAAPAGEMRATEEPSPMGATGPGPEGTPWAEGGPGPESSPGQEPGAEPSKPALADGPAEAPIAGTVRDDPDVGWRDLEATDDLPDGADAFRDSEGGGGEEDLPFEEDGADLDEDAYYGEMPGGGHRVPRWATASRTWWIGGTLVVMAVAVVLLLQGSDSPTSLDIAAEGRGGPSAVLPGAERPLDPPARAPGTAEPEAGAADPHTGPEPVADVPPSVAAPTPESAVPPSGSPPTTAVETPAPSARLMLEGGTEAALEAYRNGDLPLAASLWARRLASTEPGAYTLQVLVACQESTLARMHRNVPASERLLLAATDLGGRSCYRIGWGIYASRDAAESARSDVPDYFTAGGDRPVPLPLSRLAG